MSKVQVLTQPELVVEAVLIKADGTRINLGVLQKTTWFERFIKKVKGVFKHG